MRNTAASPVRLLRLAILVFAVFHAAAFAFSQGRAAPTRPSALQIAWTTARIRQQEFVDLREVGRHLG